MHHEQAAAFAAGAAGAITGVPGRRARDERARCDQPADRHRRLLLRLAAGRLHHGPGQPLRAEGRPADPPARLPGDRHRLDGGADHEGGVAGLHARGGARSGSTAAFALATAGRPGPGPARHPDGRPAARRSPPTRRSARTSPRRRPTRPRSTSCSTALARAERPLILAGRRGSHRARAVPVLRALLGTPRACRVVSSLHGDRRAALRPSAARRDDRQLRQPLGEHGDRPRRPPAGARQPARHPPDRRRHRRSSRATARSSTSTASRARSTTASRAVAPSSATSASSSRRVAGARPASACRGRGWQDELDELARALAGHERAAASSRASTRTCSCTSSRPPRPPQAPSSPTSASTRCGRRSRSSCRSDQRFLTSGGMGAMGSALPLAVGVGVRRSAPGRADRGRRQLPDATSRSSDGRAQPAADQDGRSSTTTATGWCASSRRATSTGATPRRCSATARRPSPRSPPPTASRRGRSMIRTRSRKASPDSGTTPSRRRCSL